MGSVIQFNGATTKDIPCDSMLENIKDHNLDTVVVMGIKDGVPSFYSSTGDGGCVIVLMEKLKELILKEAVFV